MKKLLFAVLAVVSVLASTPSMSATVQLTYDGTVSSAGPGFFAFSGPIHAEFVFDDTTAPNPFVTGLFELGGSVNVDIGGSSWSSSAFIINQFGSGSQIDLVAFNSSSPISGPVPLQSITLSIFGSNLFSDRDILPSNDDTWSINSTAFILRSSSSLLQASPFNTTATLGALVEDNSDVSTVPLPAGFALLLSALAGLFMVRGKVQRISS